jgi:hypothetical protein
MGGLQRLQVSSAGFNDSQLAQELGFQLGQVASYGRGDESFVKLSVWRFRDSTGAYAAMLQIPAASTEGGGSRPLTNWLENSIQVGEAKISVVGNLLVQLEGTSKYANFNAKDLSDALSQIPGRVTQDVPALPSWLPAKGKVSGSERLIIGPIGASRFLKGVVASDLDFVAAEEALVAQYKTEKMGEQTVTVLNYPTPQRAKQAEKAIRARGEKAVKRDGVIVAVVFGATDPQAVEATLSGVKYSFSVAELLHIPKLGPKPWDFIVAFVQLAALIIGACLLGGGTLAGYRWWRERQPGYQPVEEYTRIKLNE